MESHTCAVEQHETAPIYTAHIQQALDENADRMAHAGVFPEIKILVQYISGNSGNDTDRLPQIPEIAEVRMKTAYTRMAWLKRIPEQKRGPLIPELPDAQTGNRICLAGVFRRSMELTPEIPEIAAG